VLEIKEIIINIVNDSKRDLKRDLFFLFKLVLVLFIISFLCFFINFKLKLIISGILIIIFYLVVVYKVNKVIDKFFRNILNSISVYVLKINLNYKHDFYLDSNMPEFNFFTKNNFVFKFVNDFILYNFKDYVNQDFFRYIINKAATLDFNPLSLKKNSFISILDIIFTNSKRSEIFFDGLCILFDSFKYLNYKPIIIFKYQNMDSNLNYSLDLDNLKLPKKSLEIMEIPTEKNNFYIINKSEIVFSDNEFLFKKDLYNDIENKNNFDTDFKDSKLSLISSYFYNIDFDIISFKDAGFILNQENNINFIYYKNDLDNFYFIKDKIFQTIDLLKNFQNFIIIIFRSSVYVFIDKLVMKDLIKTLDILPSNTLEKYIWAIDIIFGSNEKVYQKLEHKLKFFYEKTSSQKLNFDFLLNLSNSLNKI